MLIVCPSCKTKFSLDEQRVGPTGIKLRCSKCQNVFRVVRKMPEPVAPNSSVVPVGAPPARKTRVLMANESAPFCAAVQKVLANEPFDVVTYNDGKEALAAIEELKPDVVLLDVALPSMFGFEVCEAVRKNPETAAVKIILIASIYDKTRYKRSPQSLYGADDYIEKHHIPDSLAVMINRLVSGLRPTGEDSEAGARETEAKGDVAPQELSRQEIAAQEETRQELKQDEERGTTPPASPERQELPEAHLKARRLARIIVSDIVLYNQGKVEDGIRSGTFYQILSDDIQEGRALYEKRVPEEVRQGTAYLDNAFEELIAKKKREMHQ